MEHQPELRADCATADCGHFARKFIPQEPSIRGRSMAKKQDRIEEHEALANHFAKESHKFESPISDALSALSEAHRQYADALRITAKKSEKPAT